VRLIAHAKRQSEDTMTRLGSIAKVIAGSIVFGTALTFCVTATAHAECAQWDLRGEIEFVQNNGMSTYLTLTQDGSKLHGTGRHLSGGYTGQWVSGSVDGAIDGDHLELTVYWNPDLIGVYSGRVGPQGRLEGSTYDRMNPHSMAGWYSGRAVTCMPVASAPPTGTGSSMKADSDPLKNRQMESQAPPKPQSPPVSPMDKLGIEPGPTIGDFLKETQP
jgi:hypothetical protein